MSFGITAGTWLAAGAAVGSAYLGSEASKDAASAQANSAMAGINSNNQALNRQIGLQEPFRQTGLVANRKLAELLGISEDVPLTVNDLTGQDLQDYNYWQHQYNAHDALANGIGNERMRDIPNQMLWRDQAGQKMQEILSRAKASQPVTPKSSDYGSLLKKFSTDDLNADPVYQSGLQFGLDQGTGAINARAMQAGSYDSGNTLKALTKYANDYGSTKANDSFNRVNTENTNIFNRLAGISGTGQTATNTVSANIGNSANTISGLLTDAGSARSAGILGQASAWGGALNTLGKTAQNWMDFNDGTSYDPNYMDTATNKWMNK